MTKGKWIQNAVKNKGALHKALGAPTGKPIPMSLLKEAAKKAGKTGRRARLALTLRRLRRLS
jgi:hypothetical protein